MLEISVPKRRRDKEGTKRKLLDAALEVFSTRGYENATTREIAARAGVSESLIQRYYDSKAGLLLALLGAFQTKIREGAVPNGSAIHPELRAGLQQVMIDYIRRETEHRDFLRVMVPRAIVDSTMASEVSAMVTKDLIGPLTGLFAEWQRAGKLRPDQNTSELATIVYSMIFSLGFMNQTVLGFSADQVLKLVGTAAQCLAEGICV